MIGKDARVNIKTTRLAKNLLDEAASALGTTLSAFLLDCAIPKAREVLAQSHRIQLNRKEAANFLEALQDSPKANAKLKQLFKKHSRKGD